MPHKPSTQNRARTRHRWLSQQDHLLKIYWSSVAFSGSLFIIAQCPALERLTHWSPSPCGTNHNITKNKKTKLEKLDSISPVSKRRIKSVVVFLFGMFLKGTDEETGFTSAPRSSSQTVESWFDSQSNHDKTLKPDFRLQEQLRHVGVVTVFAAPAWIGTYKRQVSSFIYRLQTHCGYKHFNRLFFLQIWL